MTILCWAVGLWLTGCNVPEGKPLSQKEIDAALAAPELSVLRVQARSIHHPLLAPVEISEQGLSPEQAGVLAVLANPSLRAIRDGRGVAAAQVMQAGVLPNPTAAWTNDFPYSGPDPFIAYAINLSWELSSLITRPAKVQAAQAQAASVDLDIAWQEWQVAQSAKLAVYKQLSLEGQLALAKQAADLLAENVKTVQKAVNLQQRTEVDLLAAQAAWQEAQSTALELQRDLDKQRLALRRLLGMPADAPLKLAPARWSQPPPPRTADLQKDLENCRLDLLALRRRYDAQNATVRAAVLGRFPKISAGPEHSRNNSNNHMFGYNISADLPLFDRNQGNIAIEQATQQKLFDEFVNRVYQARLDIAGSIEEIDSLRKQIALAESAVPTLQELVNDYQKALAAGTADVLTYYSARNDLDKKRIEVLKLRQDLIETWIELENSSGLYLTGPIAPPTARQERSMGVSPISSTGILPVSDKTSEDMAETALGHTGRMPVPQSCRPTLPPAAPVRPENGGNKP